jgi:hypothetical protein
MTMADSERELYRRIAKLWGSDDPEDHNKADELVEMHKNLQILEELLFEFESQESGAGTGRVVALNSFVAERYARNLGWVRGWLKSELGLR